MYAALVTVTIDPAHADQARKSLETEVIPMISGASGFVAGYWLKALEGKAPGIVVFDTEEQARQMAPAVGSTPLPGVSVDSVEFREVEASA